MKLLRFTYISAAFMLVAALFFTSCAQINESIPVDNTISTEEEIAAYPVTIGSLIFNSAPESVASLSPAVTEIIAEFNYSNRLIGRSTYCTYPESITSIDTLGSSANPDVDAIIQKAPQLLISQSPIAKKDISAIEAAGTRVLIISAPVSVEELYDLYNSIYKVFNGNDPSGADKVTKLFEPLEKSFTDNKNVLGSYVFILSPELAVASDSTFAGDFFSHFGKNSAADNKTNSLSTNELLELDPDCLILSSDMTENDLPEELNDLSAIKNGKIIILDTDTSELLERPTSRLSAAADFVIDATSDFTTDDTNESESTDVVSYNDVE